MSALAVLALRQRTPEWIEERRHHLGSSDAPVLAGERGSLLSLWAEKRGLVDPTFDEDTEELMKIGELLEPSLRALYSFDTGRPVRQRKVLLVSRTWPVASASLDAESGRRIVETKWSHSAEWFRAIAEGSADPVPGRVMAQVQWQMFVTGRDVVDVAILIGRDYKTIEVGRDDRYIADLEYMARWFWPFVESGERPPVDGSADTTRTIARLHPRDDGAWLPADPELTELVEQFRAAKAATKSAEELEGTLANTLRTLIGDASGITGLASWKKNRDSVSEVTDWQAVAHAYDRIVDRVHEWLNGNPEATEADVRRMTAEWATGAVQSIHTNTVTKEGPRVLRLLAGGKSQ